MKSFTEQELKLMHEITRQVQISGGQARTIANLQDKIVNMIEEKQGEIETDE